MNLYDILYSIIFAIIPVILHIINKDIFINTKVLTSVNRGGITNEKYII